MKNKPSPNFRYWQTESHHWKDEITLRKRTLPIYHLQELFLSDYLGRCGPIRVLEFGCGYGRHLEYLNRMDGIEVHGYEQSSAMVDQLDWADPDWLSERVTVGEPLGSLPYEDDSFDVVMTVSVLIHMSPEDARRTVEELTRISRWQILHIESNSDEKPGLTSMMHGGCWSHDFNDLYAGVPPELEVLPKRFVEEDIYRVVLDPQKELPQVGEISSQISLALDSSMTQQFKEFEARSIREGKTLAAKEQQREESRKMAERQSGLRQEMAERARKAESKIEPLRLRARRAEAQLNGIRHQAPLLRKIIARLGELEKTLAATVEALISEEDIPPSLLEGVAGLESELEKTRSSLSDFILSLNQSIMN